MRQSAARLRSCACMLATWEPLTSASCTKSRSGRGEARRAAGRRVCRSGEVEMGIGVESVESVDALTRCARCGGSEKERAADAGVRGAGAGHGLLRQQRAGQPRARLQLVQPRRAGPRVRVHACVGQGHVPSHLWRAVSLSRRAALSVVVALSHGVATSIVAVARCWSHISCADAHRVCLALYYGSPSVLSDAGNCRRVCHDGKLRSAATKPVPRRTFRIFDRIVNVRPLLDDASATERS
eukprot:1687486-Rhodomonas_salina.3